MAIERWEIWDRFAKLQKQLNKMLDEFFTAFDPSHLPGKPSFSPSIHMYRSEKYLVVRAALPGVLAEDMDVTLEEDALVIRGELLEPLDLVEQMHFFSELRYGYFERRVRIPEGYDLGTVELQYGEGMLEIKLARIEETQE